MVDRNLQLGLSFTSFQLDSNVDVHIKKKTNHSRRLKLCDIFPCKLLLELILTEVGKIEAVAE